MIHNKDFEILKQFLGDYKGEIHGRSLVGKLKMSQKAIALALDGLEKEGVLKSRKQGNMKLFSINTDNDRAKDMVIVAEIKKKTEFLRIHPKLSDILKQDDRSQRKDSDVDMFIIGSKRKEDYDRKGALLDMEISIKYFSDKQFESLLKSKNNLVSEIISNHVIIFGAERFIHISWRCYYGLD
ncbi:MAG: hypothetical protein NT001_05385 [Candidatus Woesearchaeota archaeon]|nr:hypothetical protein [Candidatus Woesearchaeota archaeon]